jgi:hypothetical protein
MPLTSFWKRTARTNPACGLRRDAPADALLGRPLSAAQPVVVETAVFEIQDAA